MKEKTSSYFFKSGDIQKNGLSSENKVLLNRKGNVFFNSGDIESAKRIFITTGYSDGLTRVGDFYQKKNQYLKALQMYEFAHNMRKIEPLLKLMADVIKIVLKKDKNG